MVIYYYGQPLLTTKMLGNYLPVLFFANTTHTPLPKTR